MPADSMHGCSQRRQAAIDSDTRLPGYRPGELQGASILY